MLQEIEYNWFQDGGALIQVYENKVELVFVPQYCGSEELFKTIDLNENITVEMAIEKAKKIADQYL